MKPLDLSLRVVAMLGLAPAAWAEDQLPGSAEAQLPPPGVMSTAPSPDDIEFLPTSVEKAPSLQFDLREIEPVLPQLPAATASTQLFAAPRVLVKEFRFVGNTVFSSGDLHKVLKTYTGRELTSEEIEAARQAITTHYVNHGYINSGAVLEDQDIALGVIEFHVVEGRLTEIKVTGNRWFRTFWLRQELRRAAGNPLNFNGLKQGLQLMRQTPTIAQVNAELQPGGKPGESILTAQVKDTQPFEASLTFSNNRPPSVGSNNIVVNVADNNLFGINDPLRFEWGPAHSGGNISDGWEYAGNANFGGSYAFPFTPWGTTFEIHGYKSDSAIIEEPFNLLNITSRLANYGLSVTQPIIRTLNNELSASVGLEKAYSKTFLLGLPFDITPGSVNGVSDVTMIPLTLQGLNRSQVHVLSLRSTVNIGITALGATSNNGPQPDSNFVSWIGQAEYIRRLFDNGTMLVARTNVQLSNRQLLSLEQFSLGGMDSVRGYAENELLRDNGVFNSVEIRVPVWKRKEDEPIVTIAPFFDVGTGWNEAKANTASPTSQTQTLSSLGVGLLVSPTKWINGQLYWGHGFQRNFVISGDNLQYDGVHFSLTISTP